MARRYALREDQWERIQGLLPGRDARGDLPSRFGDVCHQ